MAITPVLLTTVTQIDPLLVLVDGWPETVQKLATRIGEEPIDTGASITDHAVADPPVLQMTGIVSDMQGTDRVAEAWQAVYRMQQGTEVMRVVTEWGIYDEMLIERAEGRQVGRGMQLEMQMRQVVRVEAARVLQPPPPPPSGGRSDFGARATSFLEAQNPGEGREGVSNRGLTPYEIFDVTVYGHSTDITEADVAAERDARSIFSPSGLAEDVPTNSPSREYFVTIDTPTAVDENVFFGDSPVKPVYNPRQNIRSAVPGGVNPTPRSEGPINFNPS